jgi:signal peptidase II
MPASASPANPRRSTTDDRPPEGIDGGADSGAESIASPALSRQTLLYLVALVAFLLDRVTKSLVQHNLVLNAPDRLLGGVVYLTRTQNTGAAFSVGVTYGTFFLLLAAGASAGIIFYNRRIPTRETWLRVGLGMILGGAIGNALDRAVAGSVTDFIDLRWWPVFNLADSFIVVGAVVSAVRLSGRDHQSRIRP